MTPEQVAAIRARQIARMSEELGCNAHVVPTPDPDEGPACIAAEIADISVLLVEVERLWDLLERTRCRQRITSERIETLRLEIAQYERNDSDERCCCEFDANPYDACEDTPETAWHFHRTCPHCYHEWWSLHCRHDGHQNPCPNCHTRPEPLPS